jgi:hypothetical protein
MIAVLTAVVFAATPTVVVQEDGTIVASVVVQAPVALARSRVSDPVWVSRTDGGGTTVTVTGRDGPCLLLDMVTTNVVADIHYATRLCPTAEGVASTLRSADLFTAYATSWRVTPEGTGSRLEYRLFMQTNLLLPQSFIVASSQKGVRDLIERVAAALDG